MKVWHIIGVIITYKLEVEDNRSDVNNWQAIIHLAAAVVESHIKIRNSITRYYKDEILVQ